MSDTSDKTGSLERVTNAAARAGLPIEIRRMGASTRTAEEAAQQCGCDVAQIVKSLIFHGERSGELERRLLALVGEAGDRGTVGEQSDRGEQREEQERRRKEDRRLAPQAPGATHSSAR